MDAETPDDTQTAHIMVRKQKDVILSRATAVASEAGTPLRFVPHILFKV
jgi:hypothetical protein